MVSKRFLLIGLIGFLMAEMAIGESYVDGGAGPKGGVLQFSEDMRVEVIHDKVRRQIKVWLWDLDFKPFRSFGEREGL